jgi:hypothetical protein
LNRALRAPNAHSLHLAVDRGSPNPELPRGFRGRHPCLDEFDRRLDLGQVKRLPSRQLALGSRSRNAILGSLRDQAPLKMSNGPEHVEDELTGSGRGVDLLFEAEQGNAVVAQLRDRRQQIGKRPPEPVEPHHRQRVAFTRIGEKFRKAGPIHALARHDIGEHLNRAGLLQPHGLAGHILVAGADAGITQNVAQALSPKRTFRGRKARRRDLLSEPVPTLCLFIPFRP